jgi:hypothetical protein
MHQFHHLAPSFGLSGGKALGVRRIDIRNPRAVDGPLILPDRPVDIDGLPCNIPFSGSLGLEDMPVESPVADPVNLPELMEVGQDIGLQLLGIYAIDPEEEGRWLDLPDFGISEFRRDASPDGHGTVPGAVNYLIRMDLPQTLPGQDNRSSRFSAFQDGTDETGVEKDLDAGLGAHPVEHELENLRIERGHMVMARRNPCGKSRRMADRPGMDGPAEGNEPVHDFSDKTPDALDFARCIKTSHERTDKALGGHSAETAPFIDDKGRDSKAGGRNRRADTGRAASDDKDFRLLAGNNFTGNRL